MNDAVKIAKIQAQRDKTIAAIGLVRDLVKNPIIEVVAGFVLVETLQRYPKNRPIIGNIQGDIIEAGIGGLIMAQQMAPLVPYATQGLGELLGAVGKLAPLLAAA